MTGPLQRRGRLDLLDDEGPLRQGAAAEDDFVKDLLEHIGLDWEAPVFRMLSSRQKTLAVTILH